MPTDYTIDARGCAKGSASVWSNAFTLGAGDKFRPGWFVFDPATRGMAANTPYEYEIVTKDAAGKELNHTAGSFTVGDANTVSALQAYKGAPVMARFTNVAPATANTMRLSYRRNGTADAYTTVDVGRVGLGTFDWDTSALEVATSQAYEFKFDALGADNRIVARAHGVITVGDAAGASISGYASDATPTLINFEVPDDNGVAATATQMVLQYRKTGTTPYTAITLTRTSAAKPFVLDASSAIPPGTAGSIDYTYTLKNASNVTLVDVDGTTIQVSGKAVLAAADAPETVTTSVTDAAAVQYKIRRSQVLNAFGETIAEIDANDKRTDFTYNTLGRLIQKQDPETNVTLANGFIKRARPTTKYYYDALGRLVGTDDANGNRKTMLLASGISVGQLDDQGNAEALVFKEFHADGGVVENGYDVFGLKRFTKDELLRRTDYTYDAAERLTQVQRAARTGGTYNTKRATDSYAYDAAGNRISHTATPDGAALYTDKTYFDALGRITKGVSAENRTTTMTYAWDSALKGAGGATVGGWKKTTSNGLTGTKQSAADTSTTPTTITATVDAVNIFGQTVSHTDLGGRVYTYTYNLAGWLTAQSSTAGQSIGYEYYANGYIKKTVDNVTGAWTEYGYDKVGNRTYEAYSRMVGGLGGNRVYEQNAKISYDELNRVKFIDDLRANITYEYDAQSNRRRVWSVYQDGVYGYESTQEYWYTYDSMNRFLVTRGSLAARASTEGGAATILATGVDGVKVAYDKAGQRTQAIYGLDGHREDYTYTADGLVENTYINATSASQGALRASRTNDLMGRVGAYTEYDTNGTTVTRNRTTTFDKDNRQTGQTETYKGTTSTTVNTLLADGTLSKVVTTGGTTTTLNYAYEWWDSAKQSRITEQAYNPALGMNNNLWKPGVSHYTYDVNGHLLGAIDEQLNKSFTYVNNAQGQVMLREQRDAGTLKQTHRYYYAEGKAVGDVGNDGDTNVDYATQLADTSSTGNTYTDRQNAYKNWRPVSSADFDQNYQAITASYPGTAPGSYVVQAGDSLYSIAASQWGDASLWYLIAEANGLNGASSLTAGQTLSIPNKVTNVHNSSSTSGVYDAGKTMGDTSPTIPDAPPPPRQDKGGCGALATIIVIVVAAVVTGGVGLTLAAGSTGFAAAGAWAVAGAVGSIASQGVAMAMGVQQDFSWKAVGVSALGAAVTAGLGGAPSSGGAGATSASQSSFMNLTGWQAAAARAATASVITQGVGSVLGISSFSWRSVAASAAGAGMSTALGETRWMDAVNPFDAGTDAAKIFNGTAGGMVNGGVQAGIFDTKPNWGSIAAQSFGQAVGDSTVEQIQQADFNRRHPVVSADEKAAILGMFEGGPEVEPAGNGLRVGGSSNAGLRLAADAAARWSDSVDNGIKDKTLAWENYESASDRLQAQRGANAQGAAEKERIAQNARADAYAKELELRAAAEAAPKRGMSQEDSHALYMRMGGRTASYAAAAGSGYRYVQKGDQASSITGNEPKTFAEGAADKSQQLASEKLPLYLEYMGQQPLLSEIIGAQSVPGTADALKSIYQGGAIAANGGWSVTHTVAGSRTVGPIRGGTQAIVVVNTAPKPGMPMVMGLPAAPAPSTFAQVGSAAMSGARNAPGLSLVGTALEYQLYGLAGQSQVARKTWGTDFVVDATLDVQKGVVAGTFGAATGATAGAVVGSVFPVVGTAVGALVGFTAGVGYAYAIEWGYSQAGTRDYFKDLAGGK